MVEVIKFLTTKIIIPGLKSGKYWLKELFSCVRYKDYLLQLFPTLLIVLILKYAWKVKLFDVIFKLRLGTELFRQKDRELRPDFS